MNTPKAKQAPLWPSISSPMNHGPEGGDVDESLIHRHCRFFYCKTILKVDAGSLSEGTRGGVDPPKAVHRLNSSRE